MSRPRVAVVAWGADDPAGHTARVLQEASDRYEVVSVGPNLHPSLRERVKWRRTPGWPRRPARARWLALAAGANAALRRQHVDLVHELTPLPLVTGSVDLVSPYYSYTALYEVLGGRPPGAPPLAWRANRALLRALERWAYSPGRVGMLAAQCPSHREELERLFPGVPTAVVPRGTDTSRFRPPSDAERGEARRRLGIEAGGRVAILVARAEPYKGLPLAIAALGELRGRGRRPPLLLVMSPPSRWAPRLARRAGVADRVRFLGWPGAPERFLVAADLFLLPTAYETWCQAAHEAAACALPVVASPATGIAELIGDDEAGIAVARDPVAIAAVIARLEDDEGLRRRLGAEGRRRAEAEGIERFAAETVALYEGLQRRGTPAAGAGPSRSSSPGRS